MLNWSRLGAVVAFGLVVQVALLNQIVVWGAHPDLLVLFPVAAGLVQGPQRGAIVGFIAGLAADLVVQLPFGLSPLAFVLAGFAAGLVGKTTAASDLGLGDALRCALLGTATAALYALIGTAVAQPGLLSSQTGRALAIVAVGAAVLSIPVLSMINWSFAGARKGGWSSVPSGGSALG